MFKNAPGIETLPPKQKSVIHPNISGDLLTVPFSSTTSGSNVWTLR